MEGLLQRELAPVDPTVLEALDAGPMDPADAVDVAQIDRLLDPTPLDVEVGHCFMPDGVGYVAMRVEMPEVTGEMVDWWFDWHPDDPLRYRVWHPQAHVSNSADRSRASSEKPYWFTTHHPVEDVGLGVDHLRIDFLPPSHLGFSDAALSRSSATIVGGFAGDDKKHARHTRMVHVWLDDPATGGTVLRSRFWIGSVMRPHAPKPLASAVAGVINRKTFRRALVPRRAPEAVARHCAEEYTNLASLLPELYAESSA